MMRASWMARLNALVLGFLLVGGGSGLPLVDAALYHLHGRVHAAGIHLSDPASGSHGERCTLGSPAQLLSPAADVRPSEQFSNLPCSALPQPEPATLLGAAHRGTCLARAPPAPLA